jgi:FtsP/CotA-like multicopper oxidase with cupredoxin domain
MWVLVVLACGTVPSAAAQSSALAVLQDGDIRLKEAVDRNPDQHVLEIDLTARVADVEISPGRHVKAWTYDGSLPGPLIRASVGDRVIVHFHNQLPQPTTVHWHGVRVPIAMDGVPGISQEEVKPQESFTYDFVVRDAGLYWYHPHVMSAAQVGFGLYGALLVDDPAERSTVGVPDEVTIVLSDIDIDEHGVLGNPDTGGAAGMVFGREGEAVLVNGKVRPHIRMRPGVPQRWRIVNAAKSRFFDLDLDGQPFVQIGGDGGLQEFSERRDQVLIAPGERADLIVTPRGAPGSTQTLLSVLYNRGYGSTEFRIPETLMTIELAGDAPSSAQALPRVTRMITPAPVEGATMVDFTLTLPPVDAAGHNEFRVNGKPYWNARPYRSALGERQVWTVKNDTEFDHPFHLHGFFFLVLDDKNRPRRPLAWKDTVNVPMKSTVRLLVNFDERPGAWMFHCHILDHADGGLMGTVLVGDVTPATPHAH